MREIKIGPPDAPVIFNDGGIVVHSYAQEEKAEIYRQAIISRLQGNEGASPDIQRNAVMSAIREIEKRESQPCHGCGDR